MDAPWTVIICERILASHTTCQPDIMIRLAQDAQRKGDLYMGKKSVRHILIVPCGPHFYV